MIGSGIVRPRVLVADGDAERRARTRRALGDEFVLAEAAAADEALVWLEDQAPGLTLADYRLPGAAGAEHSSVESTIRRMSRDATEGILQIPFNWPAGW